MAKETTSNIGAAFDAMLLEQYRDYARELAARQMLFPLLRLPDPTRWQRIRRRALGIVRWPFRQLAYGFAWLGGLSPRDEWE